MASIAQYCLGRSSVGFNQITSIVARAFSRSPGLIRLVRQPLGARTAGPQLTPGAAAGHGKQPHYDNICQRFSGRSQPG